MDSYTLVTLEVLIVADTEEQAIKEKDSLVKAINRLEVAGRLDDISVRTISVEQKG